MLSFQLLVERRAKLRKERGAMLLGIGAQFAGLIEEAAARGCCLPVVGEI